MRAARPRIRQIEALAALHRPAAHHLVRHFRMELDAIGVTPIAERLVGKGAPLRQQLGAMGEREAFAMPMIDMVRPDLGAIRAGAEQAGAGLGGLDRVIADLDQPFRMRRHRGAEMPRQHLRAEADAEIGLALLERHADPVDLGPHIIVAVIGALRPAEDDGAGMLVQRLGQRLAEAGAAYVEAETEGGEPMPDPAGRGMLLVEHDQDRRRHLCRTSSASGRRPIPRRNMLKLHGFAVASSTRSPETKKYSLFLLIQVHFRWRHLTTF